MWLPIKKPAAQSIETIGHQIIITNAAIAVMNLAVIAPTFFPFLH